MAGGSTKKIERYHKMFGYTIFNNLAAHGHNRLMIQQQKLLGNTDRDAWVLTSI